MLFIPKVPGDLANCLKIVSCQAPLDDPSQVWTHALSFGSFDVIWGKMFFVLPITFDSIEIESGVSHNVFLLPRCINRYATCTWPIWVTKRPHVTLTWGQILTTFLRSTCIYFDESRRGEHDGFLTTTRWCPKYFTSILRAEVICGKQFVKNVYFDLLWPLCLIFVDRSILTTC